jgi:chromosome segregation ATPase
VEIFSVLRTHVKGFRGDVFSLVEAINPKFELAMRIAFGKSLDYLVIESAEQAAKVNEILKSRGFSKDLLILENVPFV